jgi:hypothetical protein
MTTPTGYSAATPRHAEINASAGQAYRTKKSFVAVHFDPGGKGEIVFLPEGVMLRITGPSSCLGDGFEVMFGKQFLQRFRSRFVYSMQPNFRARTSQ